MTPDLERRPTEILGMARDDDHRTAMLVSMNRVDPEFREQWEKDRDAIQADLNLHYRSPEASAKALGILGYMDLSERQQEQGPVAQSFTRAEKFMRRLFEPAVRSAIHTGLIER